MKTLLDYIDIYIRKLKINRFSFKDYMNNYRLKILWNLRRKSVAKNNYSPLLKKGYDLIFIDTFEKDTWSNKKKWWIGEHWGEYHSDKPNVYYGPPELTDRGAKFTCKYNPKTYDNINIPFQDSLLSTATIFETLYGRFECRMTLPDNAHSWPAFWLWGADKGKYQEIDVIETLGKRTGKMGKYQQINLHWEGKKRRHLNPWLINLGNIGDKYYYEFALEWEKDKVEIFVNGVKVFQFTNKKILNEFFTSPMWIVVNNSIRNYNKHDKNFYSEFYIDYIRVYNKRA